MKRWIRKRHDQRHSTLSPSSRRCRARRLAFERCEDRRMLSGSSLTAELVGISPATEGGFLTVNTSGFLLTNTNNFLFDADNSPQSANNLVLSDFMVSFGQPLDTLSTAGIVGGNIFIAGITSNMSDADVPFSDNVEVGDVGVGDVGFGSVGPDTLGPSTVGNDAASSIAAPTYGPTFYDFDLSDTLDLEPLVPSTGDRDRVTQDEDNLAIDDRQGSLSNVAPGLPGKTTKLLVIEDSIQIGVFSPRTAAADQREGGALEVATAVHNTQQAYETQLSAVIAHNLDRNAVLPTTVATPARPVVAEIARAVAFETLGQQRVISTGEIDRVKVQPLRESTEVTSPRLNPVAAQLRTTPADSTAAVNATIDATTQSSRALRSAKGTAANLVERIENEQQSAQIANFAQWPTLATVIASFLLIETRRSHVAPPTEQLPLRRQRRHKR